MRKHQRFAQAGSCQTVAPAHYGYWIIGESIKVDVITLLRGVSMDMHDIQPASLSALQHLQIVGPDNAGILFPRKVSIGSAHTGEKYPTCPGINGRAHQITQVRRDNGQSLLELFRVVARLFDGLSPPKEPRYSGKRAE